jgi:alpha-N-acetylglucosamine transferase
MYAFVLVHFGNNPKYLELEIYFLLNLRKKTKNNIIYLYSINDTPNNFLKIIKKICTQIVPYDDNLITYNITDFKSHYAHFNTLRTCNFMFANLLTNYKKVCIVESDMIIVRNIDKIFELQCPSVLYYPNESYNLYENNLVKIDKKILLNTCSNKSNINGGIFLFEPSKEKLQEYIKNMNLIITNNCKYPNETLMLYVNPIFYNLPMQYNFTHYFFKKWSIKNKQNHKIFIYHFNESVYKPIDIVRDGWLDKIDDFRKKKIIEYFKNKFYDKYHIKIDNLIKQI